MQPECYYKKILDKVKMRNILFEGGKKPHKGYILLKCQCHKKRQRKAEELFQSEKDWTDITTECSMWSKTGSCTWGKENLQRPFLGPLLKPE